MTQHGASTRQPVQINSSFQMVSVPLNTRGERSRARSGRALTKSNGRLTTCRLATYGRGLGARWLPLTFTGRPLVAHEHRPLWHVRPTRASHYALHNYSHDLPHSNSRMQFSKGPRASQDRSPNACFLTWYVAYCSRPKPTFVELYTASWTLLFGSVPKWGPVHRSHACCATTGDTVAKLAYDGAMTMSSNPDVRPVCIYIAPLALALAHISPTDTPTPNPPRALRHPPSRIPS